MSRPKRMLLLDIREFEKMIGQERGTYSKLAKLCGVTRQAFNSWLKSKSIPPRAISIIAAHLNWSAEDVQRVLVPQKELNEKALVRRQGKALTEIFSILAEFIECPNCGRMPRQE